MGFLDSIGTLLGGFNDVKQIDSTGFDFREKRRQEELARQQQQQEWEQSNAEFQRQQEEADIAGLAEASLAPGATPESVDAGLKPNVQGARRKFMLDRATGRSAQSKSSLASQKANTDWMLRQLSGDQRGEQITQTAEERRKTDAAKLAGVEGQTASPRDEAGWAAALERTKAGGFGGYGRGGRPQLRLVSDGQGGTEYRWISPGESGIAGAPTATQRETAGMAQNVDEVLGKMEEIAPDVTHGPILGRLSEAKQSQYPSGPEADFDQYVKQLVDLAYIKSGKQINKQELEMQLRGMISRSKGDLPGQVQRAKRYVQNILAPYEKSGAIKSGGSGETTTYGGHTYRLKPGADRKLKSSWEMIR